MTKDDFENWKDFALRMAWNIYGDRDNFEWIVEHVEDFFEELEQPEEHWVADSPKMYEYVENWDSSKAERGVDGRQPWRMEPVCDMMADFENEESPDWLSTLSSAVERGYVEGDELTAVAEQLIELWEQRWTATVSNCIRAGLDMATEIGGGVVGFTLGDVRKMYPEGLPAFARRHYDHDLDVLPDDEPIWL